MSNGTPCPEANSMPSRNWACGSPEFASLVSSAMLWAESEGEPATAAADIRIKLRLQNVREAKRRLGIEQNPLERPAAETRLSHACLAHQRFPCEDPANGIGCCCGCAKYYIAICRIGQENFRRLIRVKPRAG